MPELLTEFSSSAYLTDAQLSRLKRIPAQSKGEKSFTHNESTLWTLSNIDFSLARQLNTTDSIHLWSNPPFGLSFHPQSICRTEMVSLMQVSLNKNQLLY